MEETQFNDGVKKIANDVPTNKILQLFNLEKLNVKSYQFISLNEVNWAFQHYLQEKDSFIILN